jgi:hypothetical protein
MFRNIYITTITSKPAGFRYRAAERRPIAVGEPHYKWHIGPKRLA